MSESETMTVARAVVYLRDYNRWRRGGEGKHEDPTLIGQAIDSVCDALEFKPGRWWRALGPDGKLWCESSDEGEVRRSMRPGDTLWRIMRTEFCEWVQILPEPKQ